MTYTPQKTKATTLVVDGNKDIVQTIKGNLELDDYFVTPFTLLLLDDSIQIFNK